MSAQRMSTCEKCGASIYPEHLDTGIARYEAGKLLCSHCVEEYEAAHDATASGMHEAAGGTIAVDDSVPHGAETKVLKREVKLIGSATHAADESRYVRPLNPTGDGATRCRVFHSKLNEGAIEYMTDAINEWVDKNEDVVIKSVTSTIGIFEGKHSDPNLILTVFY